MSEDEIELLKERVVRAALRWRDADAAYSADPDGDLGDLGAAVAELGEATNALHEAMAGR